MDDKKYMLSPPVVDSIIPFLSATDYGSVLRTCRDINRNFDRTTEWKKRFPNVKNPKKLCLLRDILKRRTPLDILNEVTNQQTMDILVYGYRLLLNSSVRKDTYFTYLQSDECHPFYRKIRCEQIRLSMHEGGCIKPRKKRKRLSETQTDTHKLMKLLQLGR